MTRTIGIIGAMEMEVDTLKESLRDSSVSLFGGVEYHEGTLHGHRVVVVRCGMGKVNAALCTQALVLRFGVDSILNTGVAGSIDESLRVGDMVVPSKFVHADMDATAMGYELGQVPQMDVFMFPADAALASKLLASAREVSPGVQIIDGIAATSDKFIASVEDKQFLRDTYQAACCEMEGVAIAHAAYLLGIPFAALRCVSDTADGEGFDDYDAFEIEMSRRCASVVNQVLATW